MTYIARGRPIWEVIFAVVFCGFLTGFVCVLCIGNYYRAKRAMERQRQRRLSRLSGIADSPRSLHSSATTSAGSIHHDEMQHLLTARKAASTAQPDPSRRRNQQQEDLMAFSDLNPAPRMRV